MIDKNIYISLIMWFLVENLMFIRFAQFFERNFVVWITIIWYHQVAQIINLEKKTVS